MAEKFDWKRVLRGPLGKAEDRSSEVLFLANGDAQVTGPTFDHLSGANTATIAPPPVVDGSAEPSKEYQPSTPLVLPPRAQMGWEEDAYAPSELEKKSQEVIAHQPTEAEPQVVATPSTETVQQSPEILTPIGYPADFGTSHELSRSSSETPAFLGESLESRPIGEPIAPPVEDGHGQGIHADWQRPSEVTAAASHADDILSKFGVQKVAQKPQELQRQEAGTQNELLGDLERLISGLNLQAESAEPTVAEEAPVPSGDLAHSTIAEPPGSAIPAPEVLHPIHGEAEASHHVANTLESSADLASLLASFNPRIEPSAHVSTEQHVERTAEPDLSELLGSLSQPSTGLGAHGADAESTNLQPLGLLKSAEDSSSLGIQSDLSADMGNHDDQVPAPPEGELSFDLLPGSDGVEAAHLIEAPQVESETGGIAELTSSQPLVALQAQAILPSHDFGNDAALIAFGALKVGAEVVRLGPIVDTLPVWYRIGGAMHHVCDFDKEAGQRIINWFKHHAETVNDDTAAGDYGWFELRDGNRCHVQGTQTAFGELISARIVTSDADQSAIEDLGLSEGGVHMVKALLAKRSGLIVAAAPTGHNSEDMLATLAKYLAAHHREVVYVGDRVMTGPELIRTFRCDKSVPESQALTISRALSLGAGCVIVDHVSDPLAVASITAAANRGCLVIVGVEANDAWTAHCLWQEAVGHAATGSTSLLGVIARRQIRTLCDSCKAATGVSEDKRQILNKYLPDAHAEHLWEAVGCPQCYGIGYKGSVSLHEVVTTGPETKKAWGAKPTGNVANNVFDESGGKGTIHDALACALCGLTSWDEVQPLLD